MFERNIRFAISQMFVIRFVKACLYCEEQVCVSINKAKLSILMIIVMMMMINIASHRIRSYTKSIDFYRIITQCDSFEWVFFFEFIFVEIIDPIKVSLSRAHSLCHLYSLVCSKDIVMIFCDVQSLNNIFKWTITRSIGYLYKYWMLFSLNIHSNCIN